MSDSHAAPPVASASNVKFGLDDPKGSTIALLGLISAVLTVVMILLIQAGYYYLEDLEFENKVVKLPRPADAVKLEHDQQAKLNSASVVDAAKKQIRIPINRAMELVTEQLAHEQKKAHGDRPTSEGGSHGTGH